MTGIDLEKVRARHYRVEDECGNEYCQCGASLANCDAIQLADELERLRQQYGDKMISTALRIERLREALEQAACDLSIAASELKASRTPVEHIEQYCRSQAKIARAAIEGEKADGDD